MVRILAVDARRGLGAQGPEAELAARRHTYIRRNHGAYPRGWKERCDDRSAEGGSVRFGSWFRSRGGGGVVRPRTRRGHGSNLDSVEERAQHGIIAVPRTRGTMRDGSDG
ncbi:hypothetical protein [Oryza sativa Japonica Group]|uniref:Uncharacterized protein n=1 Tax=Oryza sativa subsp. japonica TaxID=39947 RepID=Q5JNI8_ORYSJ|nr:hypothetical protein [Oryza sativa Japonica Group]